MRKSTKKYGMGGAVQSFSSPMLAQGMQGGLSGFGTSGLGTFELGGILSAKEMNELNDIHHSQTMADGGETSSIKDILSKYGKNVSQSSLDDARIYVADLAEYNNGKLVGKWLDLSDYSSGAEVMEAIQEMLDEQTKMDKNGEVHEEYAIHDFEGFPRSFYSESMGESDFDQIYEIANVADGSNLPIDVLMEAVSDLGYEDDPERVAEAFYSSVSASMGSEFRDFAYEYIDSIGGIESAVSNPESYFDFESFGSDARMDYSDEELEEMGFNELSDEELGEQLADDVGGANALGEKTLEMYFDYDKFARDLEYDFIAVRGKDGNYYFFNRNFAKGGKVKYAQGGEIISEIKKKYVTAGSDSEGVWSYSKTTADEIAKKHNGEVQQDGSKWYVSLKKYAKGGEVEDELIEYTIPIWALSSLINGDDSGLQDEDIEKIDKFVSEVVDTYGNANFMLGEESEESEFSPYNDIDNLGSDVTILYIRPSKKYAKGGKVGGYSAWTIGQDLSHLPNKYYFLYNQDSGVRKGFYSTKKEANEAMAKYGYLAKGGEVDELKVGDIVTHKKGREYGHGRIYKTSSIGIYLEDKYGNKREQPFYFPSDFKKVKKMFADGGEVDKITPELNQKITKRAEEIYKQDGGKSQSDFDKAMNKAIVEYGFKPSSYHSAMMEIGADYDDADGYYAKGGEVGEEKYYYFEVSYAHAPRNKQKLSERTWRGVWAKSEKEAIRYVKQSIRQEYKNERPPHTFDKIYPKLLNVLTLKEYVAQEARFYKEQQERMNPKEYAKGGKIGFEGLAKKVAKRYLGKKVSKEYQAEYGKTYDAKEAKEVGNKVAGKVYKQQVAKKKIVRKLQRKTK